ncbi:hypothetical protein K438DRAFT_2016271 [Mycena galopus ATCC 62051]|nr:hypothetical protein K438DRAFT_2016271 [Mycena galopus ATCC 62051]
MSASGGTPKKRASSTSPGSHRDETERSNARDPSEGSGGLSTPSSSPLSSPLSSPSPLAGKSKRPVTVSKSARPPARSAMKSSGARSLSSTGQSVKFSDVDDHPASDTDTEVEPHTRVVLDTDEYEQYETDSDDESGSDSGEESHSYESSSGDGSDPNDKDYVDKKASVKKPKGTGKKLQGTPKKRAATTGSVSSAVKTGVKKVDPHNGICLLTNASKPTTARQFCHVVARRTSPEILTNLEWWWQMKYWTLHIDTRFNILALMATWHIAMDGRDWTLVPKYDLIAKVRKWTQNVTGGGGVGSDGKETKPFSEMYGAQKEFDYFVLPLSDDMKQVAIHRYPEGQNPHAPDAHLYPFSTIGPLTSHVHPHFVIYSAGQKLVKLTKDMGLLERQVFLDALAGGASFGRPDGPEVKRNVGYDINNLIAMYTAWYSSVGVPQRGKSHKWRQHPDAPDPSERPLASSEEQKKAAEKTKEKQKGEAKVKPKGKGKKREEAETAKEQGIEEGNLG